MAAIVILKYLLFTKKKKKKKEKFKSDNSRVPPKHAKRYVVIERIK